MSNEAHGRKLSTWLFNPAVYFAGVEALITGVVIILAASYIGQLSRTHFDGVLDVHTGVQAPPWFFLGEGLLAWLSVAIVFCVVGKIAARTSFRLIDLAGTQAMARAPMLLAAVACLVPGYSLFTQSLLKTIQSGVPPGPEAFLSADAFQFVAALLVIIVAVCWTVALMYRSYAHVCNIRGGRAGWSFVMALILAEVLSKVLIGGLAVYALSDDSWRPRKGELPQSVAATNYQHEVLYAFDMGEGIERINEDKDLSVGVENGEFRIHGKTGGPAWRPDSVLVPVADNGGAVDISGRFRVAERSGSGLIFIGANTRNAGAVIYMYQWAWPGLNAYQIQRRWLKMPSALVSERTSLRAVGNEEQAFNTMRIHIREDHQHADLFVNDTYHDTIVFTQHMGNVVSAVMEFQTDRKGESYDIRFDDLRIRRDDAPVEQGRGDCATNSVEDNIHALVLQLKAADRGERYAASVRLAELGPCATSAVPALTEAARDLEICAGPVAALGKIGVVNEEIVSVLTAALTHDQKWDRCQAAIALGRLNVTSAVPALQKALNDPDPDVQAHVRDALSALASRASAPAIIAVTPAPGATDVDPAVSEIVVTFDCDMAAGFSWTGGGSNYPPIAEGRNPHWRDSRTAVLPVKLDPGRYYRVGINSKSYRNFRSAAGVPVQPSTVYFTTRGATDDMIARTQKPVILEMRPANGESAVDPKTTELRVTFSLAMGSGFSWTGGGPEYPSQPEGEQPRWTEDQRTCVLPVRLEPNRQYRLGLNSPSHNNFQSDAGVPLAPVIYTFRTGQ